MENRVLKEFASIEKNVRRNNLTVIGLIALMAVMVIVFALTLYRIDTFYASNRLVLERDGYVHRASMMSEKESLEIEIKDFMTSFYHTFYTFNQFSMDKNINLGLYKGDESIRTLYAKYKDDGWYNTVIQQNIDQIAEIKDNGFTIDVSVYPYRVSVDGLMALRKGDQTKQFILKGSCLVEVVTRDFPKNPHGFFIRGWKEDKYEVGQ
jgi:hypothetical protein